MKFIIDSSNAVSGSSLHLKVSGFSIELSDISYSGKVAIVEDSGKISIEVLPVVESLPLISELSMEDNLIPSIANEEFLKKPSLSEDIQNEVQEKHLIQSVSDVQNISPDILFKKLVELRRQIAQEANLPPYIIFHDTTLKDMVSKMPVDLDEMKEVSGVGQSKLQKYGSRFIDVIKEYLANSA